MQRLIRQETTGLVTIPHEMLERDGLLDGDGRPRKGQSMLVDRLGERCYLVRAVDGEVPEVENYVAIERLGAQKLLQQNELGQRAD